MQIVIFESERWNEAEKNGLTPKKTKALIKQAATDAAKYLPKLSPHLNITVYPHADAVVKETGTVGWSWDAERVEIYFDQSLPYGLENMQKQLRATTFHELSHAARRLKVPYNPLMKEYVLAEGLATAFERDYAESNVPWIEYEDDETMTKWLDELGELEERNDHYLFDHPDGRRWITYKTGLWVVDYIMRTRVISLKKLTTMTPDEVFYFFNET